MKTQLTIPFVKKCLEENDLPTETKGNCLYASLAQEDDLAIGLKDDNFYVSLLLPEDDHNKWFTIESECTDCGHFVKQFDKSLKQLEEFVETYTKIRDVKEEENKTPATPGKGLLS